MKLFFFSLTFEAPKWLLQTKLATFLFIFRLLCTFWYEKHVHQISYWSAKLISRWFPPPPLTSWEGYRANLGDLGGSLYIVLPVGVPILVPTHCICRDFFEERWDAFFFSLFSWGRSILCQSDSRGLGKAVLLRNSGQKVGCNFFSSYR